MIIVIIKVDIISFGVTFRKKWGDFDALLSSIQHMEGDLKLNSRNDIEKVIRNILR